MTVNLKKLKIRNGEEEILCDIRSDTYVKPTSGIPESDLSQTVQTSLEKADSAYQKPSTGIPESDLATGVKNSLVFEKSTGENSAKLRNSGSVADSDYSLAIGYNTYAGLKGYKWLTHTAISNDSNTLTLTKTPDWSVGDVISVVTKNGKYHNVAVVEGISGAVVTLGYYEVTPPNYTDSDNNPDNAVYCLAKPAIGDIDLGQYSHVEGNGSKALNISAHAEGTGAEALGHHSHAEGYQTSAYFAAHAEGQNTVARGQASHTEGARTEAYGPASHAEGADTVASGERAHAEGDYTQAFGNYSHAEGKSTDAEGNYAHAEGYMTMAIGDFSHVEGINSQAEGVQAHAEGSGTHANGSASHAEGSLTRATGDYAHAEGLGSNSTGATGNRAHSEGYQTTASGNDSHSEGYQTSASGARTHAEGSNTTATNLIEHAEGRFNKSNKASSSFGNSGNTLHSIGIGSSSSARSNAFEVMQNGDVYINGIGGYDGTNPSSASTLKQVIDGKQDKFLIAEYNVTDYGSINEAYDDEKEVVCRLDNLDDTTSQNFYYTTNDVDSHARISIPLVGYDVNADMYIFRLVITAYKDTGSSTLPEVLLRITLLVDNDDNWYKDIKEIMTI